MRWRRRGCPFGDEARPEDAGGEWPRILPGTNDVPRGLAALVYGFVFVVFLKFTVVLFPLSLLFHDM